NVGQTSNVSVVWMSQNIPVAGRALRFSITAGSIVGSATATTDQNGRAIVAVASDSAGPAKISVESVDTGQPKTSVDVEFVATVPSDVTIDASSSLVHTNETSTITALVVDALGNPVKHQEVDFNSVDSRGGQINPASAITNGSGIASVTFTAGANATEIDAIQVHSTVKGTSITDSMRLTVSKRALNVTLGTSNEVEIKAMGTQYAMPFIVQVADGSGTPLENAAVNLTVKPLRYYKGQMELYDKDGLTREFADDFTAHHWGVAVAGYLECPTEDINGNRYLDVIGPDNEDINQNGSLDPQDPASLTPVDDEEYATLLGGSLDTDGNGSGYFQLMYPASNALWARVKITARAEALGSEADASFEVSLPLPAIEALDVNSSPANMYSPYSQASDGDYTALRTVTIDGEQAVVFSGCTRSF
ncbi:MAG: Ig-like domain-containing protein, partial [Granulosicoccus sp.]